MNLTLIKTKILLVLSVLFVTLFCPIPVFAKNRVSKMNIDVSIHNNGSATITQRWIGTFDEGTEVYLPIEDKSLIVRNLKVWKDGREYLEADGWNPDWSFESKKWRSGIYRTAKGVELCFGISEYGNNTYTFSYDIDPLVKAYRDADGFNFQFVNPKMSTFPSDVVLRIGLDNDRKLTTDTARIWGFGYVGMATFSEEGYAVAYSTSPLSGSNYMNITLEIFKGLLTPNVDVRDAFEAAILNKARENSSYNETLKEKNRRMNSTRTIFMIIVGFISAGIVAKIYASVKRKNALKKYYNDLVYFRDNPNDGDISVSYTLYKDFDIWKNKETNVIGAIIMKMINNGNLEPIQEKSYSFFGKEKVNTNLKIGKEPEEPILKELFDIIVRAAGDDGILQEKELKNYASNNYEILNNYLESLEVKGHNTLNKNYCYNRIDGNCLEDLNEKGQKELAEVYGLRKFLDEFTLINERGIMEGIIWEDLIVYATLFGLAKKVLDELKDLYPDKLVEIEKLSDTYYISDIYFRSLYYSSINGRRAANAIKMAEMAAEGLGGMASLSGGGGFSGGGSGGGTR